MFGNGIGTLSIVLVDSQNNQNERELWSLSGEAGNAWYQAEVTIASPNPFRVSFEQEKKVKYVARV